MAETVELQHQREKGEIFLPFWSYLIFVVEIQREKIAQRSRKEQVAVNRKKTKFSLRFSWRDARFDNGDGN